MRYLALFALLIAAACDTPSPSVPAPRGPLPELPAARTGSAQSLADFRVVVRQVEPVAERVCREQQPRLNCDFRIVVDDRPNLPPNAYQTLERDGRPVIGFTTALFGEMRNRDEIAFALSHEAAHHIEGHIPQTQNTAALGMILGTVFGQLAGLDPQGIETAQNIGGTVGARRYSKAFELEADSLGAVIARRAGYDPLRGVLYFQRAADPGNQFLGTHPPNAERITVVRQTLARN